jgi:L-aspartate oxidase
VDVAVVGAGAAGLYAALCAAREGARVALVSRSPLAASASYWAQGGVAAALASEDSPERHLTDTLAAGRGAARPTAARVLCEEAPARVRDLAALGVRFDGDRHGSLALGLEGGHSARRVAHAGGSATGRRITRQLSALVATDERIDVLEGVSANALWVQADRCVGLLAERVRGPRDAFPRRRAGVLARATMLATGGAAALWLRTTNPRGAIGAGLSLAHAAGATLADLELVQFHPTALALEGEHDGFLVTEAMRGEGALLVDEAGQRFVDELAPRDVVALAIHERLLATRADAVGLDLRPVDLRRFPNVAATLRRAGLDPGRELVPVAPAAHYTIGGVATDVDGRSSLPGLYAVGECACTGLHGANRLASNSLAECFVFAGRAAVAAAAEPAPSREAGRLPQPGPSPVPAPESRAALWRFAGLERSADGLSALIRDEFPLARRIGRSALARTESRGAHQRTDFPEPDTALEGMHTVVRGDAEPALERWT